MRRSVLLVIRRSFFFASLLVVAILASWSFVQARPASSASLLGQTMSLIRTDYVTPVANDSLYDKAARGLVRELNDPYSVLYSPKELANFDATSSGHYAGIGTEIAGSAGDVVVQRVFPGTPAAEAHVLEGDKIVAIDTASTLKMSATDVSDRIKGSAGTRVDLSFVRNGSPAVFTRTFTRAVVTVPAVPYTLMLPDSIGYIPLLQFTETASSEVAEAVARLKHQGARGIVLDFRGNPGGILEEAMSVSNLFLKRGLPIASVRSRSASDVYKATRDPLTPDLPLVVLSDGGSASAAEIVMGALQDHDRALIVGTTSFGKGLVQSIFPLAGGYAVKLTTAKWYTPSGRSIQKERKLLPNGDLVEVLPDSVETDSVRRHRPIFKSDDGRVVYGGGAITPDVIVSADTLTTQEQRLLASITVKPLITEAVFERFALEHKGSISPGFVVPGAWRDTVFSRLVAHGVVVDHGQFQTGKRIIDRLIGDDVTRLSFGDSAVRRRDIPQDPQLLRALEVLQGSLTQRELFSAASRSVSRRQIKA